MTNCVLSADAASSSSSPIVREEDSQGALIMHQDLASPLLQNVQKPHLKRGRHQGVVVEERWTIKKSRRSAATASAMVVAPCNNGDHVVGQVRIQEEEKSTSRSTGRNNNNSKPSSDDDNSNYGRSLTYTFRCLGVTKVTPVLAKSLTRTDARLDQGRLQISSSEFTESPLPSMLTPDEYAAVHTEAGLPVEALDRHGYSYDMRLGFVNLSSNIAYRLRKGWTKFLTRSGARQKNLIHIGAFRAPHADGKLMLTLLNYATNGSIMPEEMDAADGLLLLSAA